MASERRSGKPSFEEAIRAYAGASRQEQKADITVDEILAYVEGEISPDQVDGFRDRLVLNQEAAKLVADLASFPDLEPSLEVQSWVPEDGLRQRETLERRLVQDGLKPSSMKDRQQSSWFPKTLAAVFFLTAVGLGLWVQVLYQKTSALSSPGENIDLLTLRSGALQRDLEKIELQNLVLRDDSALVVLMLRAPRATSGDRFRADVFAGGEVPIWQHEELRSDASGNLTLLWPRSSLRASDYRIEIHTGSGTDGLVATYRVKVQFEGGL